MKAVVKKVRWFGVEAPMVSLKEMVYVVTYLDYFNKRPMWEKFEEIFGKEITERVRNGEELEVELTDEQVERIMRGR